VKFAKRGRVHTVIGHLALHMRVKLNHDARTGDGLSIAQRHPRAHQIDDVEWSAEDGTRSEMDYLCRIVRP